MDDVFDKRKVYNDCANNPHCPAIEYISNDALFVEFDKEINCPYRINLGDRNICECIGRNWHYKNYGK